jgi:hypothetical protein
MQLITDSKSRLTILSQTCNTNSIMPFKSCEQLTVIKQISEKNCEPWGPNKKLGDMSKCVSLWFY